MKRTTQFQLLALGRRGDNSVLITKTEPVRLLYIHKKNAWSFVTDEVVDNDGGEYLYDESMNRMDMSPYDSSEQSIRTDNVHVLRDYPRFGFPDEVDDVMVLIREDASKKALLELENEDVSFLQTLSVHLWTQPENMFSIDTDLIFKEGLKVEDISFDELLTTIKDQYGDINMQYPTRDVQEPVFPFLKYMDDETMGTYPPKLKTFDVFSVFQTESTCTGKVWYWNFMGEFPYLAAELSKLISCLEDTSARFVIIPIVVRTRPLRDLDVWDVRHSNTIIIDKKNKTALFFEPYGTLTEDNERKMSRLRVITKNIMDCFGLTFSTYADSCPVGLQKEENKEGEGSGWCLSWNLLWVYTSIAQPDLSPAEVNVLLKELSRGSLRNLIISFTRWVHELAPSKYSLGVTSKHLNVSRMYPTLKFI